MQGSPAHSREKKEKLEAVGLCQRRVSQASIKSSSKSDKKIKVLIKKGPQLKLENKLSKNEIQQPPLVLTIVIVYIINFIN